MSIFTLKRRSLTALFSLAVFACFLVKPSSASTVVVGTCKNLVKFSSIQAAILAVPPSSTIDICPGTYAEQLLITQPVTLTGVSSTTAGITDDGIVIIPPAGGLTANATSLASGNPIAAHVWVSNAATVNMNNLAVDSIGNNLSGCGAPDVVGILYQNSSGTLNHVVTRNQWIGASESDGGSNGCQNGLGIFVQSGNSLTSTVTVTNSSVHDYQKNGITGNEVGTTLIATNNTVVGQGATTGAAENGIQIGFGAAGTVTGNLVVDDVWAPDTITDPGDAAAGILIFDGAENSVTVKSNTVGNTQTGIALVTDTVGLGEGATVTGNKVFGTRIFDGIDVCSQNNTVSTNTVTNSSQSAIHLDGSCGTGSGTHNAVTGNTLLDACTGVLDDSGGPNTESPNTFFAAGTEIGSSCSVAPSRNTAAIGGKPKTARSYRVPARP